MEFRNVLLAIVLSTLVLIVWATFFEAPINEQQTSENQITKNEYKPLIIDCGSNNGASSIYFSLTYPEAKIISLEIDESNYLQSLKNIETNKLVVELLNQGVASEDGYGDFIDPGLGNNAYRIEKASGSTGLSLISITSIIKNIRYEEKVIPFLVKIDIEGGEKELFSKNKNWIKDFPVMTCASNSAVKLDSKSNNLSAAPRTADKLVPIFAASIWSYIITSDA